MAGSVILDVSLHDPFVWVSAIMLVLLVIVFLWLVLVTMRRAGNDVWQATLLHRQQQHLTRASRPRSVYTPPATVEEASSPSMPLLPKFPVDVEKLRPSLPRLPPFNADIVTGGQFIDDNTTAGEFVGCMELHDVIEKSRTAQHSCSLHQSTGSYRYSTYLPLSLQIGLKACEGNFSSLYAPRSCSIREA